VIATMPAAITCALADEVIDLVLLEEKLDALGHLAATPRERSMTLAKSNVTSFTLSP
jgi:hypothetical protein